MKWVYCISGLGADERIFQHLQIRGFALKHLRWIQPLSGESMKEYAYRMCAQLPEGPVILLGVSFGGMMALEMAKHKPTRRVILISSVKSSREMPPWMRISGRLRLNRLAPARPWKWLAGIENVFLGAKTPEEKKLAGEFRSQVDREYLAWALQQVLTWQNSWQPPGLIHLHGSGDHTFPIRNIRPTHTIAGGGHFMVMNRAGEISRILEELLNKSD